MVMEIMSGASSALETLFDRGYEVFEKIASGAKKRKEERKRCNLWRIAE
jgi:hypothetical protein